jgi:hypothetical protein
VARLSHNCTRGWNDADATSSSSRPRVVQDFDPSVLWEVFGFDAVVIVAAGTVITAPVRDVVCSALPFSLYVDFDYDGPHHFSSVLSPPSGAAASNTSFKQRVVDDAQRFGFAPLLVTPVMVLRPSAETAVNLRIHATHSPWLAGRSTRNAVGFVHNPSSHAASLLELYFYILKPADTAAVGATSTNTGSESRKKDAEDPARGQGLYLPSCVVRASSRFCSGNTPTFVLPRDTLAINDSSSTIAIIARGESDGMLKQRQRMLTGTVEEPGAHGERNRTQLVFLHVPRSGGRSVECTLGEYKFSSNAAFRRAQQHVRGDWPPPIALCCGGHANLAVLSNRFGPPTPSLLYVTMFRDVPHRVASALAHDNRIHTVTHLRVSGNLRRAVRNGTLTLAMYMEAPPEERTVNHAVAIMTGAGRGTTDPANLALAKYKLLELRVAVGVHERFSDSLRMFLLSAGGFYLGTDSFLSCSDTGPPTPRPTHAEAEELMGMHALDSELYRFAESLFRRQWFVVHAEVPYNIHRIVPPSQCDPEGGCLLTSRPSDVVPNTTRPVNGGETVCWRKCQLQITPT